MLARFSPSVSEYDQETLNLNPNLRARSGCSSPTIDRFKLIRVFSTLMIFGCHALNACAQEKPSSEERVVEKQCLVKAHAHNDYLHPRPLLDALEQGFGSIEADVFLVGGKLRVAHSLVEIRNDRTLDALYLKPLAARCEAHGGRVYRNGPELLLLVDFKSNAESTYERLAEELAPYSKHLTRLEDGKLISGAIRVVVSGNRPVEILKAEQSRLAFIDGRVNDLVENSPVDLIPLVSDQWSKHFKWQGSGEMSVVEKQKLAEMVSLVHQQHRKLRFWGVPDNAVSWKQLLLADVDLINTDKLAELAEFLRSQP